MVTSSNSDDLNDFLAEIDNEVGHINPPKTIDLLHKNVNCYLCKKTVKVERSYRLKETCPNCFEWLRLVYVKAYP